MNSKQIFGACCLCCDKSGIWFVHEKVSILFYYKFDVQKVIFYRIIPCERIDVTDPFWAMVYKSGKLYLFSNGQNRSFVYDISKDIFTEIIIKDICMNAFRGACIKEDYIYVFPYKYDRTIKVSRKDYKVEYLETWRDVIHCSKDFYTNSWSRIDNESFIMSVPRCQKALKYNIILEKWDAIDISDKTADYTYYACLNGYIYGLDGNNKQLNILDEYGKILKSINIEHVCARMYSVFDYILIDPIDCNFIDLYREDLIKYKRYETEYEKSALHFSNKCLTWLSDNRKCYAFDKASGLIIIDEQMNITRRVVVMDDDLYKKMLFEIRDVNNKKNMFEENEMYGLEQFISRIDKTEKSIS